MFSIRQLRVATVFAVLAVSLVWGIAQSADRCGDTADKALFRTTKWSDLRKWFERFPDCDDGYLSEGVSEYVTSILAKRWSELPTLMREIKKSPKFEDFVISHIDATADYDNLKAIVDRSTHQCPSGAEALCGSIANAGREAVGEVERILGKAKDSN